MLELLSGEYVVSRSLYYRQVPVDLVTNDLPFELIWILEQAFGDECLGQYGPLELELSRSDLRALTLLKILAEPIVADGIQALIDNIDSSPSGKITVWTER